MTNYTEIGIFYYILTYLNIIFTWNYALNKKYKNIIRDIPFPYIE